MSEIKRIIFKDKKMFILKMIKLKISKIDREN